MVYQCLAIKVFMFVLAVIDNYEIWSSKLLTSDNCVSDKSSTEVDSSTKDSDSIVRLETS